MSRRRIHILSVIDDLHFGGDEYRLLAFARSLDRERFQHTVVTLMKEDRVLGEKYGSMRDQYRQSEVRLIDIGHAAGIAQSRRKSIADRVSSFREKARKVESLIHVERVDILDVHLSPANLVCAVGALTTKIPFVVTLYQLNTMQSPALWLAGQINLGCAALLITDSEAQASLIRRWLIRQPPVKVIANGTSSPQPVGTRRSMCEAFDIPEHTSIIIGQVSSLHCYKGHLVLLDAAKQVLDRYPQCMFLMVGYERGKAGYREQLLRRAAALGIYDRVRISGYPGPIGDVWNIIDIHAHASRLDSLPNALLEAMSLGKPSVITSIGGVPEVIRNGVNGFTVPPNDPAQLAAKLLMLVGDPSLRSAIGREAQKTHAKYFQPENMTAKLENAFRELVVQ
jgi:glycosyltransferase involved in cell wall biosynthesis